MGSRQVTVEFVGFDRSQTDYSLQVIKDIALGEAGLVEGSNPEIVVCTEDLVSLRKVMQHYPETTVRILFNAELGSLDFNTFDYVIGWEELSDVPRYARLHPGLSMEASPFGSTRQLRFLPRPMRERDFCCFIATNSLAHPMRDEFFRKLNELKRVDSWGRHLNNSGTIRNSSSGLGYELEKLELESGYKFTLALENGLFAGYLTEKVFSGAKSGAIPIYWGNELIEKDFNPNSFINCHKYKDFGEVIERIKEIDNNNDLYLKMLKSPILNHYMYDDKQYTSRLKEFLYPIFDIDKMKAFRRNRMYWVKKYEENLKNKMIVQENKNSFQNRIVLYLKSYFK